MYRQWLVGLLCLVLLGGCQGEPDPEENEAALPELATELVFSVDLGEDGPRRQLTVAGDGGFYMANRFTYEVYEFPRWVRFCSVWDRREKAPASSRSRLSRWS